MIPRKAKPRGEYVIGLMSGTSADGIDAVLTEISFRGKLEARVIEHAHKSFSRAMRRKVLHLSLHGRVEEICELNFVLGELFAEAVL